MNQPSTSRKTTLLRTPCSPRSWLDPILLVIVLAVAALRSSFIEVAYHLQPNPSLPLPAEVLSILISAVLIGAFCLWLSVRLLFPPADQIISGLGTAVCVFLMTAAAAAFVASSKRDAATDLTTLAGPLLILLMLADIFRKPQRIVPTLWLLLALAVASAYQCHEQASFDNESVLQDYRKDPQRILDQLGIEPGTLKQWQFEHRLYSKDVRGFLTTSNSTGSFLLLALFACLGLLTAALRQDPSSPRTALAALYALIALIVAYGLYLCKSRGALTAGAACFLGWLGCVLRGKKLWPYRYLFVLIGIASAVLLLALAIHYGLTHGRLPGPNALLVRWQYWQSACRLIADRPLLGVGGGNFAIWYPLYKIPAAPEMVRDPHNFLLALASQYGLLAAGVFTLVLIVPLLGVLQCNLTKPSETDRQGQPSLALGSAILLASCAVLLLLRPLVTEGTLTEPNPAVRQAYYLVYYLAPAAVMALIFGLLLLAGREPTDPEALDRSLTTALSWGILAVLIHNLIDFAIFETAVLMFLMIQLASISALTATPVSLSPRPFSFRISAVLLLAVGFVGFLWIAVFPPVRSGLRIQQALSNPDQAACLLTAAEKLDRLSSQAAWLNGQWALQQYQNKIAKDPALLEQSAEAFNRALRRNPQDYRLYEALSDVFAIRAESEENPAEKTAFLEQSYAAAQEAFLRFPGSDRLTFKLGMMAQQLHDTEHALLWYCRAAEIEEAYRRQFRQMYPDYELFSRLGEERYQYAREFIRSHTQGGSEPASAP